MDAQAGRLQHCFNRQPSNKPSLALSECNAVSRNAPCHATHQPQTACNLLMSSQQENGVHLQTRQTTSWLMNSAAGSCHTRNANSGCLDRHSAAAQQHWVIMIYTQHTTCQAETRYKPQTKGRFCLGRQPSGCGWAPSPSPHWNFRPSKWTATNMCYRLFQVLGPMRCH